MKKIVALLLVFVMMFSLCGCSSDETAAPETVEVEEPQYITQNEYFSLDAICVDDSYRFQDNDVLRKVYLFFTLTASEENLETDSKYIYLKINDVNEYESYLTLEERALFQSYYHSQYIEDVYMGQSLRVFTTFEIPVADLEPGRTITIQDANIPKMDEIILNTDMIQYFNSPEEMAQQVDAEGYEKLLYLYEEADEETIEIVNNQVLNKKFFSYSTLTGVNVSVTFRSDNRCEVALGPLESEANYSIRRGYIFITLDNAPDTEYKFAYSLNESGVISMDVAEMVGL